MHRRKDSEAIGRQPRALFLRRFPRGAVLLLVWLPIGCTGFDAVDLSRLGERPLSVATVEPEREVQPAMAEPPLPSGGSARAPSDPLHPPPLKALSLALGGPIQGKGAVTSVEAQATRIGAAILEAGGNAMDAAVATAFALAVTHPSAGNLGGGGFLLVRRGTEIAALDFREDAPSSLTDKSFFKMLELGAKTGAAVGVPGTVAGLLAAHERFGRLPLGRVIFPAEKLADQGYVLGPRQAQTLLWSRDDLARDPVARRVFFSGKETAPAGTKIKRPDLALALRRVREHGKKGFYRGRTAEDIVQSLGPDGIMTLADLARYDAKFREPLWFDYRGYRVVTMPPPSGGGVALTQILMMLGALPAAAEPSQFYHLFSEASRRGQLERLLFVRAPEREDPSSARALRARWLDPSTWLAKNPLNPTQRTPSAALQSGPGLDQREEDHTTHLSVVDREGMAVSMTLTLSGSFGARVFSRETGIALNNSVASFSALGRNQPEGGVRTVSSMSPTLVVDERNTLVLGSPGGDTIPSTVALLILRLLDGGQDFPTAIAAPRIHQGLIPDVLDIERNRPLPLPVLTALKKKGHVISRKRSAQGDANIAAWLNGTAYAIADEREGGLALSVP